jgi:hypothetical protein
VPAYYARVAFRGHLTATGALIVNTVHVECDILASPPNWTSVANDMDTWLGQKWLNILTTADTFDDITVTDENYPGSTHGQGIKSKAIVGTRVPLDEKLDAAVCDLASFKTAVAKRYGRGHCFMPPAYGSNTIASTSGWNQADPYRGMINTWDVAYAGGFVAGSSSYIPIIFSRHKVELGESPFTFPVTATAISAKQHWLRSRSTAP